MRLLILGGTGFLGGELVAQALEAGHQVTLLNRGASAPGRFPGVAHHPVDRAGVWQPPAGQDWDAAVDVWPCRPAWVRAAATRLAPRVERLAFVSSVSVYADLDLLGLTEVARLEPWPSGVAEDAEPHQHYGAFKARCEDAVREAAPGRALILRPGLIVGPGDSSDRFPYWPRRLAAGGEVVAPGDPARRVQLIDVRDLAAFLLRLLEAGTTGTVHASGPARPLGMGPMLEACMRGVGSTACLRWVPEAALEAAGVAPWMGMPLWLPREKQGMLELDLGKALDLGLVCRPLEETARDTLAWDRARGPDAPRGCGPTAAQEAALLG